MLYCRTVKTIITLTALAGLLLTSGCMMPDRDKQVAANEAKLAEEGYLQLEPGSEAPAVEIRAIGGTAIVSPDEPPAGPVLLFFITAPDTPNCAREVHQLERAAAELSAAGIRTAIVIPTGVEQAASYQAEHGPSLMAVADPELDVSIPYGCAVEDVDYLQRTQVGIAADGTIAFFERGFFLNSAKQVLEAFGLASSE
jgi:peroxiredoxin